MTDIGRRVLIVEDEPEIRNLLRVSLGAHGYLIDEAVAGYDGVARAAAGKPDILVLDLGLPDIDGKDVVTRIREWSQVPILILTVRDQEKDKIEALDAGANDYVTKPFSMGELMARIRVLLRQKTVSENEPVFACGDLVVDLAQRKVSVRGSEIKLTPTEYEIIKVLSQQAGRVLTHKQMLKLVWGDSYEGDTHYLRVYIGQLRRKIEENPTQPRYIITESGVGYRLVCNDLSAKED